MRQSLELAKPTPREAVPDPESMLRGLSGDTQLFELPKICYQAAGGGLPWADHLELAWFLFYIAAHLMDNVEDQDDPGQLWASYSPGVRINVASGLFFTAANSLNYLHHDGDSRAAANEIIEVFYSSFLRMCSGQNEDLLNEKINLALYWRIASSKSGDFFGMGCWAGARLATDDTTRLEGFRQFGYNLGIHKQIRDDLEEIQGLEDRLTRNNQIPGLGIQPSDLSKLRRALPIVYAYEVLPLPERIWIDQYLESINPSQDDADKLLQILDRAGTALYVAAELERYRSRALTAIEQAGPNSQGKDILVSFL